MIDKLNVVLVVVILALGWYVTHQSGKIEDLTDTKKSLEVSLDLVKEELSKKEQEHKVTVKALEDLTGKKAEVVQVKEKTLRQIKEVIDNAETVDPDVTAGALDDLMWVAYCETARTGNVDQTSCATKGVTK